MNFQNFQLKWKIVKHFLRPKQQAALRKLFSLPSTYSPPDKILLRVWKKIFLIEIYKNIFLFGARNNICIAPFLTPNRNMFSGKFLKSERVVSVLQENIVLSVKVVEICKMSEVFWAIQYCKWVSFLTNFCWLWDFLLENLKLRKTLMMSSGTCGRVWKICVPKIIFSSKEFQMWDSESFIFLSKFPFLGDCFRMF